MAADASDGIGTCCKREATESDEGNAGDNSPGRFETSGNTDEKSDHLSMMPGRCSSEGGRGNLSSDKASD